jgi:predicted O-methyltransferase YrrM
MQTIEDYIIQHTQKEDPILYELNRETNLKTVQPRMISGHYQGILLEQISKMIRPERILEIGTFTGYSAICLAKGLKQNGTIHSIEINDELENIILKYFKKARIENRVKLHFGNALKIIPELKEKFDLVYIDAEKTEYLNYYITVFEKIRNGGFILVDNTLWNGKVVMPNQLNDKATQSIIEFNSYVKNDSKTESIILNVRDGLTLIRKK